MLLQFSLIYIYIYPKYAVCGSFSMKYDVFSFGVIVLEVVVKKENTNQCLRHMLRNQK